MSQTVEAKQSLSTHQLCQAVLARRTCFSCSTRTSSRVFSMSGILDLRFSFVRSQELSMNLYLLCAWHFFFDLNGVDDERDVVGYKDQERPPTATYE